MSDSDNALAVVRTNKFKMPRFGMRAQVLMQKLDEVLQNEDADVISHTEASVSKHILHIADEISAGNFTVEPNQMDVTGKPSSPG